MRRKCEDWCGWTIADMERSGRWPGEDRPPVSVHWFENCGYCSPRCMGWAQVKRAHEACDTCGFLTGGRPHECRP